MKNWPDIKKTRKNGNIGEMNNKNGTKNILAGILFHHTFTKVNAKYYKIRTNRIEIDMEKSSNVNEGEE